MTAATEGPGRGGQPPLGTGPGSVFHGVCAVVALALLWSSSVPGVDFFVFVCAATALMGLALVWLVRLVRDVARRRRVSRRFLVAPLGGALALVLLLADVPFELRWAASRSSFDQALEELPPASQHRGVRAPSRPGRVGLYEVPSAFRLESGAIFYERTGALMRDAGFAYLPHGLTAELEASFEDPQLVPIGDGWYRWTASW